MSTPFRAGSAFAWWEMVSKPGFLDSGKLHQFQNRTIARFREQFSQLAQEANTELGAALEQTYREGEGTLASTTRAAITDSGPNGVTIQITTGAAHAVFLTALAGEPTVSPGHWITPSRARLLKFHWKNPTNGRPAGVYSFRQVFWKPRVQGDIIGNVLSGYAERFQRIVIEGHRTAVAELVQEGTENVTRSPRVRVR